MDVLKMGFITIIFLSFLFSLYFLALHFVFKNSKFTDQASAKLLRKQSKKDVPVYGRNFWRGPIHQVMTIKNQTTGIYIYEVNGKSYKKRYKDLVTSNQMANTILISYIKKFPKISYVKSDIIGAKFWIYSLTCAFMGILALLGYFEIILK